MPFQGTRRFFISIISLILVAGIFAGANYARGQALQAKWDAAARQAAGRDPVQWWLSRSLNADKTHKGIFQGVDLTYIYDETGLHANLALSPRTNLGTIQFKFEDLQSLAIDGNGEALVQTAFGTFRLSVPTFSQALNGQDIPLSGGYQQSSKGTLGFWSGYFDANQSLQIRFSMEVVQQKSAVVSDPRAPQVVSIGATKVDSLAIDVDGDTKADPGDTLGYAVTISNSGDQDATGVQFTDTIDANTTLVPGSIDTTPLAIADSYSAVGNVRIQVPVGSGLLANDTEPDGTGGLTITPETKLSTNNGNVTINADGSFTYNPFPGFEGADTFTYTLNDGEGNTDIGTVTITVSGMIWFINNSATPPGDGRLTSPFSSIANFNSTASDDPGDNIFVFTGGAAYAGPITLLNNQRFIGAGASSTLSTITGLTPPTFSDAFPATGGTAPTINTNGVTLGSGNTMRGFVIDNTGANAKITGNGFGTLTLGNSTPDVTLSGTGMALNLTNGTFAATSGLVSVASTSSGTQGVLLSSVAGTVSLGSTTISGSTTQGILVTGSTVSVNFGNTSVTGGTDAISLQNNSSGTRTFGTIGTTNNSGVAFLHAVGGGAVSAGATTITNPGGRGMDIQNSTTAISFGNTTANSSGGTGVFLNANSGTVTFGDLDIAPDANQRGLHATDNSNTITATSGTISNGGAVVVEITRGSGTTPLGITLTSVSANGGSSGIILTNTSGFFVIAGDGGSTNNSSGGTIQNSTSHGISLSNTTNISLDQMNIQNTARSGIDGVSVTNFGFTNGTINNSGTAAVAGDFLSNIAFNNNNLLGNNINGTLTVTGSTLTNAYYGGVMVSNDNGTISNATITGNTITSSTNTATSKGTGIDLIGTGNASTVSSLTKATISSNTIRNFPSGAGIQVNYSSSNASGPGTTAGIPGDVTNIISITNNTSRGFDATNRFGTHAIIFAISGGNSSQRARGNFDVSNNGTVAEPIGNCIGIALGVGNNGYATMTATINNNVIVANNSLASSGISGGNGVVIGNETPDLTLTVNDNNISATDGNGILLVGRGTGNVSSGTQGIARLKIQDNIVAAPLSGVRPGIRIDAGNTAANTDDAICLNIEGNTSAGSGGSQGIGLRKQGTNPTIHDFGVNGMVATSSPGVEAYVDSLNPAGGGTLLISATSGFSNCSLPLVENLDLGLPLNVNLGKEQVTQQNQLITGIIEEAKSKYNPFVTFASVRSPVRPRAEVVAVANAINQQENPLNVAPSINTPSSGETINLAIGTLPFGKSITVRFRAVIDIPFPQGVGQVCNQSTISGSNFSNVLSDDPDVGGSADPTCTTLSQADLAVTKSDSPDPVAVGNNITYTINFANNGPDGATNVDVTDSVPLNTTFVSSQVLIGTGWTLTAPNPGETGDVSFTKAAVANAETATFEIVVQTNAGLPDGTIISNTVNATSETPDGDTADNADTETTLVQAPADIAVTKTDSPDPVIAGNNITYTIDFVNNGPNASNNVSVSDATPANLTFVSAAVISGTGWTVTTPPVGGTGTVSFDKGLVATSETATFQIVVNVNANTADATIISNTVNATSTTLDNDLSNNTDTETTTVQARADLAVTKSDSPDPVVAGTNLTYTVDFVNNGPSDATGVSVTDAVPLNTTFVSATAPAGWLSTTPPVGGTGTVTFSKATVLAGETAQFTIVVNVNASTLNGTVITNTATASSTTQDSNAGNNTGTATTTVIAQAELSITKSDTPDPVDAGANITYTLDFTNAGPSDAQAVSITDATPANTTFVSATAPAGWTSTTPPVGGTGTITFTNPTVAAGATAQFTIVVNVNSDTADAATISNTADVSSATTDPNTANNTDTETTTVQTSADLSITKTDSQDPIAAGTNLTYTLDFTNNGPSDAQNVSIIDAVPANTTFVSATAPAGWTVTTPPVGGTGNVVFDKTPVTGGETAQFSIVVAIAADVPDGTVITNTATVTTVTTDPDAANNSDTETTTVNASSDLSVTKIDSVDPAVAGQNLTYTINFANSGPSDAQNVDVSDPVPANTTFVSATVTSGTGWTVTTPPVGGTGTVSFTKATVLSAETATFDIVVNIDPATPDNTILSNTVTVTSDSADPNPGNDSATETTLVREPSDLSITKDDGVTDVNPGQSLTYTIVASNAGPRDDPAAVVADDLPPELINVTWTCVGTGGGICTLSGNGDINETVNLPAGGSVTFTVNAVVDFGATNQIVNTATVTPGPDITDPDPSNNTATDTDTIVCLFCDEFNDSTLNTNWTYVKLISQWTEDGNNLIGANDRKTRATAEPVFAGCSTCTIFTSMQTAGGTFNRVWLYGWYQDVDNNVELLMKQESGTWVLKQRVGGFIVAKQKVKLTILPNTVYNVRITFNGTDFQVFIDGSSTPNITLTAVQAPNGSVGFKVKGTTGIFDFIRVF